MLNYRINKTVTIQWIATQQAGWSSARSEDGDLPGRRPAADRRGKPKNDWLSGWGGGPWVTEEVQRLTETLPRTWQDTK